jgi:hypothetical protein
MILIPETLHRILPAIVITVVIRLIVNPPDELTDLPFVLVLVVSPVEFLTDRHHVWQSPVSFREIQHAPLDLGKENFVPIRLPEDSAN